jgi:hypothetical protein
VELLRKNNMVNLVYMTFLHYISAFCVKEGSLCQIKFLSSFSNISSYLRFSSFSYSYILLPKFCLVFSLFHEAGNCRLRITEGVVVLYMARIQMLVFHVKESLSFIPYKFGARNFITTV